MWGSTNSGSIVPPNLLDIQTVAYEAEEGGCCPPSLKNSGQTLFSGQAQVPQKS